MKNLGDAVEASLIRKRVRIPSSPLQSAEETEPSPLAETPLSPTLPRLCFLPGLLPRLLK